MSWSDVGHWLFSNGSGLLSLAGSIATGNVPAGIAAVSTLVSQATGETAPDQALAKLQNDPATLLALKKLLSENEQSLRAHQETMLKAQLEDEQKNQEQQQQTIRGGDTATDEYIRRTRPKMAKQSWYATVIYCLGCFGIRAITSHDIFDPYIAGILSSPAWAYLGFRTGDKFADAWKQRGQSK